MPSAQEVSQNPAQDRRLPQKDNRGSWGLILLGIILLILALLMFLYVKGYRPSQKKFVFEGRIERAPPTAFKGSTPLILSLSSASVSKPESKPSSAARELISALSIFKHSQHAPLQKASALSQTQTQPQQVTPKQTQAQEKPNPLRRFFRWLAGLFKGKKRERNRPNSPPVISAVSLSESTLALEPNCPPGTKPAQDCTFKGNQVQVRIEASDADGDELRYQPSVGVGKLFGGQGNFTWDLTGVSPGTHTLNVSASDGEAETKLYPVTLNVRQCDCREIILYSLPCPYPVSVSAPAPVRAGDVITFSSDVGYSGSSALNYNWTVSPADAHILSGAGTPTITIDTTGLAGQSVTAILVVDDGSGARACRQTAQATTNVVGLIPPRNGFKTTMRGRIVDKNGDAIQGAEVAILGKDGQWRRTITDVRGRYEFADLPFSTYRMTVSHPKFGRQVRTVSLNIPPSHVIIGDPEPPDIVGGAKLVESLPGVVLLPDGKSQPVAGKATPSPTPSPTPYTTTPPSLLKVRKQDEIRVYYPERFLKDKESEVSFELEQVFRQVISSMINTDGQIAVTSKPAAIPGVAAGTPLSEAFEGYDAYATVRLIPKGLLITSEPPVMEQLLDEKLARWMWKVKPEENAGEEVSFSFEVSVVWKAKNDPQNVKVVPNVWPHQPFTVPTGPPLTVKAAGYTAPVSLGGGVVTLGLGVMQKRRRRLLGEDGLEEETLVAEEMEEPEDEVSSTVYAPTQALPGDSFLVQVFVHLPEQAAGLEELAREADDEARARITTKLKKTIKRGTELMFHLTMPGLEIDEPAQSCTWEGEPVWAQFGVTIPPERRPGNIIGTVIVSESSIPIGHLKFKFKIAGSVPQATPEPVNQAIAVGNMTRYKQAFISYTSRDRAEVLKRVQMLNLVKVKFFQDLLTLEPGDAWEKLLYQYIDQSDVFYLFWSQAASESEWVKKEIAYAIKRKGGNEESAPEIVPVIIEKPAARPPEELSFLHFNDKFIYFISAEDAEN